MITDLLDRLDKNNSIETTLNSMSTISAAPKTKNGFTFLRNKPIRINTRTDSNIYM